MSYPPGPPGSPPPMPPPGGPPQPGYGLPTSEERNWALASHVGTFVAAWFAMGFIAPLVIMLVKGNDSPFVRKHAVESLNFQISLLIYIVAGFLITLVTFGIGALVVVPVAIVVGIFALVVIILATIKAANGEDYRYPLCLRLVS
jgi:uncharacterized protein